MRDGEVNSTGPRSGTKKLQQPRDDLEKLRYLYND